MSKPIKVRMPDGSIRNTKISKSVLMNKELLETQHLKKLRSKYYLYTFNKITEYWYAIRDYTEQDSDMLYVIKENFEYDKQQYARMKLRDHSNDKKVLSVEFFSKYPPHFIGRTGIINAVKFWDKEFIHDIQAFVKQHEYAFAVVQNSKFGKPLILHADE